VTYNPYPVSVPLGRIEIGPWGTETKIEMEHALFLDKPVRGNPRRRAQELSVSMLPSPPCETTSPAPSIPSQSTSTHDSYVGLTSTTEKSTAEHMAIIASMTRPQWRTDTDLPVAQAFPDQSPEESSVTPGPLQQRRPVRGKATKAACSTCRKRKSKVRRNIPSCTYL
jgi:hypothetical protein